MEPYTQADSKICIINNVYRNSALIHKNGLARHILYLKVLSNIVMVDFTNLLNQDA